MLLPARLHSSMPRFFSIIAIIIAVPREGEPR